MCACLRIDYELPPPMDQALRSLVSPWITEMMDAMQARVHVAVGIHRNYFILVPAPVGEAAERRADWFGSCDAACVYMFGNADEGVGSRNWHHRVQSCFVTF